MSKFHGLPSINMISLRESVDRRNAMDLQMKTYGVPRHEYFLTDRWDVVGKHSEVITKYPEYSAPVQGTLISHLNMMRHWYLTTDEPYAIFSDDDTDFSTCEYWNFTWEDFVNNLPLNWKFVQLLRARMDPMDISKNAWDSYLKMTYGRYWGVCALMSREYVKMCLDTHIKAYNLYDLRLLANDWDYPDYRDPNLYEYVENVLYLNKWPIVYNFPLFLNSDVTKTESTYNSIEYVDHAHKSEHNKCWVVSREVFLELWQNADKNFDICSALKP